MEFSFSGINGVGLQWPTTYPNAWGSMISLQ